MSRYHPEGEAAFQPRSRRPHTSPARLPQQTTDLIIALRADLASKGFDNGPATIAWHLRHHHGLAVGAATIHRHLRAAGLISPQPQKRPKSSYIRFAAEQPNERWQADFTHWWALSRLLKSVVAQLGLKQSRWNTVGSFTFQAAASSAVTSRQTAKRSSISVRHWVALSRCLRGRKCAEMPLNADRNRWACRTDLKRFILSLIHI